MTSNSETTSIQRQTVTSRDGTTISYQTLGQGPGVIVIPGALSMAADYLAFAEALAQDFTVHIIERRGRGLSGPQGEDYSMTKECEDIAALQQKTKASYLFGHSFGGLVALEAARNNQAITKIAVYEPGVSIDGSISMAWIPAYKENLAKKKYLDAFAVFSISAGPESGQKMPPWLMKFILRLFIRKHERQQIYGMLPANLLEHGQVASHDNGYKAYQEISAGVLLLSGGKHRLGWVRQSIKALSDVLPSSEQKEFPKLDHFGPAKKAPQEVAQVVKEYFLR